jgi:dTDP-4-dehydrorhamnose 3,5-epimerase
VQPTPVPFTVADTAIDGLVVITLKQVGDGRGAVRELYRASDHGPVGAAGPWRQVNLTSTRQGAVRGLHGEAMTKLVSVVAGEAFGAYVDTRGGSATCGKVVTVELRVGVQVLVPAGVCNGFQAVSATPCEYLYLFDQEWAPGMPGTAVHPLDPALGIRWPVAFDPSDRDLLSAKDAGQPTLAEALSRPA